MIHIRSLINTIFSQKAAPTGVPSMDVFIPDPGEALGMKISSVYSAVKLLGDSVGRLPLTLQRYNSAKGRFVDDYTDPLYTCLRIRPNSRFTAFEFWRSAIQHKLLRGNAYIYPRKTSEGRFELLLLSPGSVAYDPRTQMYSIADDINDISKVVSCENIIHLRNIGEDGGYTGVSTIQYAATALGILSLADHNTADTLSNGGRMRGLLSGSAGPTTFAAADTEQLKTVSAAVENDIRAGRTVVPIPADMKFQSITLSPGDAKVLESKQITTRDIARFFRVHPDLLYEGSNNTYKAAEVPNVMFLTQTLEPLLVQIESELLTKLLPQTLWGRRRIRFDREVLYSTDLQTESLYFEKMLQTGVYTVNELRLKKGQSPIPGGDIPLVSANLKGLNTIISEVNQQSNNSNEQ